MCSHYGNDYIRISVLRWLKIHSNSHSGTFHHDAACSVLYIHAFIPHYKKCKFSVYLSSFSIYMGWQEAQQAPPIISFIMQQSSSALNCSCILHLIIRQLIDFNMCSYFCSLCYDMCCLLCMPSLCVLSFLYHPDYISPNFIEFSLTTYWVHWPLTAFLT